ncbi:uncharacterized protein [Macaca nemestrina]|uniref:uncharacterized protein isoform X1 n=1 Tax=Macaca nemestrina TaxID=9545 RepID=UPI0039B84EC9
MDLPLAAAPQQPSAPATPPDPETGSLRSGCQQGWVPVRTLFLACRGAQSPFLGRETSQEWEASEQAVFCVAASFHFSPGRTLALSTSFCFPLVRPLRTAAVLSDSSCFGSNMPRRCETILLDFGVDPNIADVYGITALHLLSVMRVCQSFFSDPGKELSRIMRIGWGKTSHGFASVPALMGQADDPRTPASTTSTPAPSFINNSVPD